MGMMAVILRGRRDHEELCRVMQSSLSCRYINVDSMIVPTRKDESLEIRWLSDTNEIAVIRHSADPSDTECIYSILL